MDITEALADGEADKDAAHTSGLDFFVVGIGASAGGLAAIKSLLEGLPATPDMAFVVVLHLSPTHESSASAIFQSSTRMPVTQVQGRMAIERNHVYVIPPGNDLEMFDGMLQLVPSKRQRGRHVVIDHFFRTLAETHRTRAVGIVLSGTGSDGSVGIAALKEKGGIVLAQTPEDAEHDGMPASAIATRKVDLVLPVADMANQLVELWQNASRIEVPDRVKVDQAANDARAPEEAEDALKRIMALLQQRTGHDFRHYKRATVLRRIERRMQVSRTPTLAAYRQLPAGGFGRGQEAARRHADRRDPVLPRPAGVRGAGARGPAEDLREPRRGPLDPHLGAGLLDRRGGVLGGDARRRRGGAAPRGDQVHPVRERHRRRGGGVRPQRPVQPGDRGRRAADPAAQPTSRSSATATASARRCAST